MDISASQFSRPSESGWTYYLDQSSLSGNYFRMSGGIVEYGGKGARTEEEEEEEEGDLSMVSDASSGPPHYHDDDDECCCENCYTCHTSSQHTKNSKEEKKKKKKVKESVRHQQLSHLDDDTASSPVFSCSKKKVNFSGKGVVENALNFSQGFSATRMKGKPKFQKHFGFFECSLAGKQAPKEAGGFAEEKRK